MSDQSPPVCVKMVNFIRAETKTRSEEKFEFLYNGRKWSILVTKFGSTVLVQLDTKITLVLYSDRNANLLSNETNMFGNEIVSLANYIVYHTGWGRLIIEYPGIKKVEPSAVDGSSRSSTRGGNV